VNFFAVKGFDIKLVFEEGNPFVDRAMASASALAFQFNSLGICGISKIPCSADSS
jgi:hypothetical protein